jgi:hypothetical protein
VLQLGLLHFNSIVLRDPAFYIIRKIKIASKTPSLSKAVSRIRYVYPGSEFFHPRSRIRIKELKYFNPKKWFLSSRKYDPGFHPGSRIRIHSFYPSRIPGQKGTGTRIRNTA